MKRLRLTLIYQNLSALQPALLAENGLAAHPRAHATAPSAPSPSSARRPILQSLLVTFLYGHAERERLGVDAGVLFGLHQYLVAAWARAAGGISRRGIMFGISTSGALRRASRHRRACAPHAFLRHYTQCGLSMTIDRLIMLSSVVHCLYHTPHCTPAQTALRLTSSYGSHTGACAAAASHAQTSSMDCGGSCAAVVSANRRDDRSGSRSCVRLFRRINRCAGRKDGLVLVRWVACSMVTVSGRYSCWPNIHLNKRQTTFACHSSFSRRVCLWRP